VGNEIQPFEFPATGQRVRTVLVDGEPWFYASDVCRVLGVTNVSDALTRVNSSDIGSTDTTDTYQYGAGTRTRNITVKIVNESGLYDLILDSRKPEAKSFRRWVTADVLPSIRQTGKYVSGETAPAIPDISTPAGVLAMAEQFANTARQLVATTAELEQAKPKVESFDALMSSRGNLQMGEVAKILGMGRTALFQFLRGEKILMDNPFRKDQHNVPYERYMKYFYVGTKTQRNSQGQTFIVATTYVRPEGVEYIRKRLNDARAA